jgi:hypothetical protein
MVHSSYLRMNLRIDRRNIENKSALKRECSEMTMTARDVPPDITQKLFHFLLESVEFQNLKPNANFKL